MKKLRITLTVSAAILAMARVAVSLPNEDSMIIMVDLRSSNTGICIPNQTIMNSQEFSTCNPTYSGAYCIVEIGEAIFEIHNASLTATCANVYKHP
jgi:hypothetical protein